MLYWKKEKSGRLGWKFYQVNEINTIFFLKLSLLRGQQEFGILNAALFDQLLKSIILRIICERGSLYET